MHSKKWFPFFDSSLCLSFLFLRLNTFLSKYPRFFLFFLNILSIHRVSKSQTFWFHQKKEKKFIVDFVPLIFNSRIKIRLKETKMKMKWFCDSIDESVKSIQSIT